MWQFSRCSCLGVTNVKPLRGIEGPRTRARFFLTSELDGEDSRDLNDLGGVGVGSIRLLEEDVRGCGDIVHAPDRGLW